MWHAEQGLYQNFIRVVQEMLDVGVRTKIHKANVGESPPYEELTERQRTANNARKLGKAIADQGRVVAGDPFQYCGERTSTWTVLHDNSRQLGQAVTQLRGKFYCGCHNFVERVLECSHICAVQAFQMSSAAPDHCAALLTSTLHYAMSPNYAHARSARAVAGLPSDMYKPYPPRHLSSRQRHLAKGTRVLVKQNEEELQVGAIVGKAQDTCDVSFGNSEMPSRVPYRSIIDWVSHDSGSKPRHACELTPLGGIVAAAEYKPTEQIRKARKNQTIDRFRRCRIAPLG